MHFNAEDVYDNMILCLLKLKEVISMKFIETVILLLLQKHEVSKWLGRWFSS